MTISVDIEADAASQTTNALGALTTLALAEVRAALCRYTLLAARRVMI